MPSWIGPYGHRMFAHIMQTNFIVYPRKASQKDKAVTKASQTFQSCTGIESKECMYLYEPNYLLSVTIM